MTKRRANTMYWMCIAGAILNMACFAILPIALYPIVSFLFIIGAFAYNGILKQIEKDEDDPPA